MLYPKLKFPKIKDRPFFYTNFVSTVDGKVAVKEKGYWPIGSKLDYQVLLELRAYADCLIHGGALARQFGTVTLKSINKSSFKRMRRLRGSTPNLPYWIITKHLKTLSGHLRGVATVFSGDLFALVEDLKKEGYKHILVEGGPTLLGSFLKENLIDEIFLTIAPKIYGNPAPIWCGADSTKTLVEGILFPPNKFKLKLISSKIIKDELYLRYSLRP